MSRLFLLAAISLAAHDAYAQPARPEQPLDPEKQALGETVIALTRDTVGLRAQIIAQAAEIEKLKRAAEPKPESRP